MARKISILFLLILLSFKLEAQSSEWMKAGMPFHAIDIRCIYNDTLNNALYISGTILATPTATYLNERLCKYDGLAWSAIGGVIGGQIMSVVNYNGDLIVAGPFNSINGISLFSIAKFDGTNWYPMGNFDVEVTKLKVINSDLYAMGYFNSVDGIPAKRIAKWNGSTWSDVHGFVADTMDGHITDIEIFKGNTYVCGNFSNSTLNINHLSVYKGGSWQNVGGGIIGSWTDLTKMTTYKNELYIAGQILKPDGNVGHMIQKWNDTIWSEVGGSVQDLNEGYGFCAIRDMLVYNNELYIAGGFGYTGHIPATFIAKWDGLKWCGLATKDLFTMGTGAQVGNAVGFYNDTLFLGIGNDTLNGISTNRVLKYIAGNYTDTCSIDFTGVKQLPFENGIIIYPNPATNEISIELTLTETNNTFIEIKNILGQTVKKITNDFSPGKNNIEIDISDLPKGLYFVQLQNINNTYCKKLVRQ
ncbi:MAG: hypothetical protein JWO44_1663 [Bacteroidetes bacterium]|nr:hypothetical protein [Bacteroidota bacterium]